MKGILHWPLFASPDECVARVVVARFSSIHGECYLNSRVGLVLAYSQNTRTLVVSPSEPETSTVRSSR